ncbi:NAD(+) synthase [Moheibacter sp.]|uniref:NAD(+) synthase n=1 Tax=Moheibacter sp. TaxID=1965316 RepID=UPI003C75F1BC
MQTEKIINHIVNWLSDYLKNSGQKGFVLGISGGIDSAVVSTLCAKTAYPVLCMELPIHQAENQVTRALNHINWLKSNFENVEGKSVNLTTVYDEFVSVAEKSDNEYAYNLSLANTRARLRMTTLYYYAGLYGYIVAGTGNKVEDFGVGFFTKYGDGGVDISPIADLMKSEVYEIAEFLGINYEIQKAAPTDGLFGDNRTDEDQIGASYDELEWAMKAVDRGQISKDFSGREREVMEIYEKRHRANLHKMVPIPICEIPEEWK